MKIAVMGLGARGMLYAKVAKNKGHEIVAACDISVERLKDAVSMLGASKSFCFQQAEDFFAQGKIADVLIAFDVKTGSDVDVGIMNRLSKACERN